MTKLLSANFSRLLRDKIFWIVSAVMLILAAFVAINNGITADSYYTNTNTVKSLNSCYFNILPMIGFFYSIFISFYIGTDYNDGTIRNKLIIGHNRTNIYLSNYITCIATDRQCFQCSFFRLLGGWNKVLYDYGFSLYFYNSDLNSNFNNDKYAFIKQSNNCCFNNCCQSCSGFNSIYNL